MNRERDIDLTLRSWLDDGAEQAPERFVWAALHDVELTDQRGAWRASLAGPFMRPHHTAFLAAMAVVIAVAVATTYVALTAPRLGQPDRTIAPFPSESPSESVETRTVALSTLTLGDTPTELHATADALYAAISGSIVGIDPRTNEVSAVVDVSAFGESCPECTPIGSFSFAVDEGSAWVTYHQDTQSVVRRFDLATGALIAEIALGTPQGGGGGAEGVTLAFGSAWVVNCHSATVARIDSATNEQVAVIPLELESFGSCAGPWVIAAGSDSLWVGTAIGSGDGVIRIDPRTNDVTATIPAPSGTRPCGRFAIDATSVWVSSCPASRTGAVFRVDPQQHVASTPIRLDGLAGDLVLHDGRLWVPVVSGSPRGTSSLVAIAPATGRITDAIELGTDARVQLPTAAAAVIAFDALWVAGDEGTLVRIALADLAR